MQKLIADQSIAGIATAFGLTYPQALIETLGAPDPGQQAAAIYASRAVEIYAELPPTERGVCASVLGRQFRAHPRRQSSILADLDAGLDALAKGLSEDDEAARVKTGAALMSIARKAGRRLLHLNRAAREHTPLRRSQLNGLEQALLEARGVGPESQALVGETLRWLQMSAWAMVSVELGGRQVYGNFTNDAYTLLGCRPEDADRLLLCLGANRLPLRVLDPLLLPWLPLASAAWFVPSEIAELRRLVFPFEQPSEPVANRHIERVAGRPITIEHLLFVIAPGAALVGDHRYPYSDSRLGISVIIGTPLGVMIGRLWLSPELGQMSRVQLNLSVLEDQAGFLHDLTAIQTIQAIQSLLQQAISEPRT